MCEHTFTANMQNQSSPQVTIGGWSGSGGRTHSVVVDLEGSKPHVREFHPSPRHPSLESVYAHHDGAAKLGKNPLRGSEINQLAILLMNDFINET